MKASAEHVSPHNRQDDLAISLSWGRFAAQSSKRAEDR
jgi:hypothetical protein